MVYVRIIRLAIPFTMEDKLKEFLSLKNNLYYVYGMEVGKKAEKEHFHVVLKTEYDPSTVTRKLKTLFQVTSREYSNKTPQESVTRCIAYAMKDGNYNVHWDNSEQIDDALKLIGEYQEEACFKKLREKIIYHVNKLPKIDTMMNTDLMFSILKIFKKKELAYPSQAWLKQCMVTYYMQNPTDDINMKNIQTLYNIRDPFLEK